MPYSPIDLNQKLSLFTEQWTPKIIAQMNDYHFKVVKIQGDFVWHSHPETDETFIVLNGQMRIDFRDGPVELRAGQMFVVPRGVEHKPYAAAECAVLLVEPVGTVNTGDAAEGPTAPSDHWI
jgi:mannose-6-phosphate isomerase-like protein (cupin superfamily)